MANDILQALQGWSRSIHEGLSGIGAARLDSAKLDWQIGVSEAKEARERELAPILLQRAKDEAKIVGIQATEAEAKEAHLNKTFDVESLVENLRGSDMNASQAVWFADLMAKAPSVFGDNVKLMTEPDTGKKVFYDLDKGAPIKNRDFYREENQTKLSGLIAMQADPIKWLQDAAARGEPDAITKLKEAEKDPLSLYRRVAERKEQTLMQMRASGLSTKATQFFEEGLKETKEMVKKLTMTPEERSKYEAEMKVRGLQAQHYQLAIEEQQYKLAPEREFAKLPAKEQQQVKFLVAEHGSALTALRKTEEAMDVNDPNSIVKRNIAFQNVKKITDKVDAIYDRYKVNRPGKEEPAIGATSQPSVAEQPKTKLNEKEEEQFQRWYKHQSGKLKLNPDPDDKAHYYDYRAAFKSGVRNPDKEGHWPSEFKLEGHPRMVVDGVNTKTGEPVAKPEEIGVKFEKKSGKGSGIRTASDTLFTLLTKGTKQGPLSIEQRQKVVQDFTETFGEEGKDKARKIFARANITNSPEFQGKYAEEIMKSLLQQPGWSTERAQSYGKVLSNELRPDQDLKDMVKQIKGVVKGIGEHEAWKLAADVTKFALDLGHDAIEVGIDVIGGRAGGASPELQKMLSEVSDEIGGGAGGGF